MTPSDWKLRRAEASDLDAIMVLEAAIFGTDAWSRESMERELASRHCYYVVAFEASSPDHIDGYAGLLAPRASRDADIQTIAVADAARRRGLGHLLVQTLVSEANERRASELFLEVRADNPGAQRLYKGLGFEQIGVRRGYYQPDNVDAFVMRLRLTARVPV